MSPVHRHGLHVIEEPGGTFEVDTWKPDALGPTSEEAWLTAEQVVEKILASPRHRRILMLDSKRNPTPPPESIRLLLYEHGGLGFHSEAPRPRCGDTSVIGCMPRPTCHG